MVEFKISVPEDVKKIIEKSPGINWSRIASEAIVSEAHELELLKRITSKSKLTEKDALEIGKKVNRSMARRYRKLLKK